MGIEDIGAPTTPDTQSITHQFFIEVDAGWVEITNDVIIRSTSWSKGIPSNHPLDRIASPGRLIMTLRNDAGREMDVPRRYTPGDPMCIPGFGVKTKVLIKSNWGENYKNQWLGWIVPGGISQPRYPGQKTVQIIAFDWMYFALNNPLNLAEIMTGKTFGDHAKYLVSKIEAQPTDIRTGKYREIFTTVNDTVKDKTTIFSELDKSAKSELGYAYIKYEPNTYLYDILMLEGRDDRQTNETYAGTPLTTATSGTLTTEAGDLLITEAGDYLILNELETFTALNGILAYEVKHGEHFTNRVIGKTYPRQIKSYRNLFTLGYPVRLEPGEKIEKMRIRYIPEDEYIAVNARNVEIKSYVMSINPDGTGDNLSADLQITAEFGANDGEITLENTGAEVGYVSSLVVAGDPIYIGDTITQTKEVETPDYKLFGDIELTLDQKYMSDPARTKELIDKLAEIYNTRVNEIQSFTVCVNKNKPLAGLYSFCDIGSRIPLKFTELSIEGDYTINGIETWTSGVLTYSKYYVKPVRTDTLSE